jgi:hypothetical protein
MLKLVSLLFILFICSTSFGQTKKSLEISFIGRYDRHANYVSNFAGRVYNDTNRLYGTSYGANGIFRRQITKTYSVYMGIGFYQLRVDKIRGPIPFNILATRTARNIDYDDGMTNLLYSTSQYHYNNVAITIGFDKEFLQKRTLRFDIAGEIIGYKTLAQKYRLMNGSKYYITHNNKPLELGININPGVIKEYTKFYLRPSLIIPIYQNLKGDKVFYEDGNMNISKWFNGIGLSLKIGKHL